MRTGDEPAAQNGTRPVVGSRQELGGHQEPARPAGSDRQVRDRQSQRFHLQVRARGVRGPSHVRVSAGRRGLRHVRQALRHSSAGPDSDRGLPEARRLCRAHDGLAGSRRRARRLLRPRRHDGLAARASAGRLQLAGHALARARARLLAAVVRLPRAALADRGHLGLRGTSARSRVGTGADARVRASARQGTDVRREEAAGRVQAARDAVARVLRGVARRRAPRVAQR